MKKNSGFVCYPFDWNWLELTEQTRSLTPLSFVRGLQNRGLQMQGSDGSYHGYIKSGYVMISVHVTKNEVELVRTKEFKYSSRVEETKTTFELSDRSLAIVRKLLSEV